MVRAVLRVLAVLCTVLLAAGCGDEGEGTVPSADDDAKDLPVAVVPEALRQPGTLLAPGIEVQAGSLLVATSLPLIDFYSDPGTASSLGWQAVLVVDGDPIAVWNQYVEHLDVPESARAERSCIVTAITAPTKETMGNNFVPPAKRFITDAPMDGENRIECFATVGRTTMALAAGAAACPEAGCELRSVAHLYLGVMDPPEEHGYEQFGTDQLRFDRAVEAADDPNAVIEPLPVPAGQTFTPQLGGTASRSELPKPGERIDDGLDYYLNGTPAGLVPADAHTLVAPAMLLQCNSGLVALVEIPGSPADAVAVVDGAASGDDPIKVQQGTDSGGRLWAGGQITTAGGYYMGLVALHTDDEASTVLVTECGD